jgi:hypothetical protein
MTLGLEGIGDDKVRVNAVSLDTMPEQALEIVGLEKQVTAEKMTLGLEGIGDDKFRVNAVSLDTLPEQALEIVGLAQKK